MVQWSASPSSNVTATGSIRSRSLCGLSWLVRGSCALGVWRLMCAGRSDEDSEATREHLRLAYEPPPARRETCRRRRAALTNHPLRQSNQSRRCETRQQADEMKRGGKGRRNTHGDEDGTSRHDGHSDLCFTRSLLQQPNKSATRKRTDQCDACRSDEYSSGQPKQFRSRALLEHAPWLSHRLYSWLLTVAYCRDRNLFSMARSN